MTPAEIFEYKQQWKPGYTVRLHSDVVDRGKVYCRKRLKQHQWSVTTWTGQYEHTFHFECSGEALQFKIAMGEYADQ